MSSVTEIANNSKIGHRRRPSLGKDLPISSLVIDISKPKKSYDSISRDGTSPEIRGNAGIYFQLNGVDEENFRHTNDETHASDKRQSFMSSMLHGKNNQNFNGQTNYANENFFVDTIDCDYNQNSDHSHSDDNETVENDDNYIGGNVDDDDDNDVDGDDCVLDKETEELRENFNIIEIKKKLAIAEVLARASMLTSPAVKRRLAARKVEMDLETGLSSPFQDQHGNEYVPPRELLIYLVR